MDVPIQKICFDLLQKQNRDFYGDTCRCVDMSELDSLTFLADYVKQNRPLVIKNAIANWPALQRWTSNEYLIEKLGSEHLVSVACSPYGKVDAVYHNKYFVEPHVCQMKLSQFFEQISDESDRRDQVLYVQQQNGNLDTEFPSLKSDIDISSLDELSRAFRTPIDASNIWIGTEESVSSAHKDHYENLYAQICGRKIFYLLPPAAVTHLDIQMYESARFVRDAPTGEWKIEPTSRSGGGGDSGTRGGEQNGDNDDADDDDGKVDTVDGGNQENGDDDADDAASSRSSSPDTIKVPWIKQDLRQVYEFGHVDNLYVMKVVLEPGDVLYLPSLWYHQVEQQNDELGRVIAVNFWYDMTYDQNYNYYQLLENLACEWKEEMVRMENDGFCDDGGSEEGNGDYGDFVIEESEGQGDEAQ